jgi:acyl carrier protein
MDLQKFITDFANQFDDTDISEFNENTFFQDLDEWSSLILLSVIALAKINYDKAITGAEIRSCKTVKDLYNLIESK